MVSPRPDSKPVGHDGGDHSEADSLAAWKCASNQVPSFSLPFCPHSSIQINETIRSSCLGFIEFWGKPDRFDRLSGVNPQKKEYRCFLHLKDLKSNHNNNSNSQEAITPNFKNKLSVSEGTNESFTGPIN